MRNEKSLLSPEDHIYHTSKIQEAAFLLINAEDAYAQARGVIHPSKAPNKDVPRTPAEVFSKIKKRELKVEDVEQQTTSKKKLSKTEKKILAYLKLNPGSRGPDLDKVLDVKPAYRGLLMWNLRKRGIITKKGDRRSSRWFCK